MVDLAPLQNHDRDQFVRDNQKAFLYGATDEFGLRDSHVEEDGEIISRKAILASLDAPGSRAYRILRDGNVVGGLILIVDEEARKGSLDILFVDPSAHSQGIGQAAWAKVEALFPQIDVWTTHTPYFEKRNIHFYVKLTRQNPRRWPEWGVGRKFSTPLPESEIAAILQTPKVSTAESIASGKNSAFPFVGRLVPLICGASFLLPIAKTAEKFNL